MCCCTCAVIVAWQLNVHVGYFDTALIFFRMIYNNYLYSTYLFQYLTIPKKEVVNVNFRSYWNTGVFYTFDFIANIPAHTAGIKDYIVGFATSPPAIPAKASEELQKSEETRSEENQPESLREEDKTPLPLIENVDSVPPEEGSNTAEKSE